MVSTILIASLGSCFIGVMLTILAMLYGPRILRHFGLLSFRIDADTQADPVYARQADGRFLRIDGVDIPVHIMGIPDDLDKLIRPGYKPNEEEE